MRRRRSNVVVCSCALWSVNYCALEASHVAYGTKATCLRGDVASALICTFRLLSEIDNFFGLALPQEPECLKICYFFGG